MNYFYNLISARRYAVYDISYPILEYEMNIASKMFFLHNETFRKAQGKMDLQQIHFTYKHIEVKSVKREMVYHANTKHKDADVSTL